VLGKCSDLITGSKQNWLDDYCACEKAENKTNIQRIIVIKTRHKVTLTKTTH